jgi:hypothetical protein
MNSRSRVLFISPIDMIAKNGMAHGQHQLLSALCSVYGDSVDLLSAGASLTKARHWLRNAGIQVNLVRGFFPALVRLNTMLWYVGGVILCNKLRIIDRFYFPIRTPLPRSWIDRYDVIVCYYAWHYCLLKLDRFAEKVIVDTGDVMADRHERIGVRRSISLASDDERSVLQSHSRCLAVSQDDIDEFERMYGVRPRLLSFVPSDHAKLVQVASGEMPPRLGFMGAPSYVNEEILHLLSTPTFLNRLRDANIELLIAGGICDTIDQNVLRSLAKSGARVLGRVRSTAEYYAQIAATVNPVGPSTGVKIKSVETLIAGRALITTRWGADSALVAAFPGQVAYVDWPTDPDALADACIAAVREAGPGKQAAAEAYVLNATRLLRESLVL